MPHTSALDRRPLKKPTQCFVLEVSIKKPPYCQLLTSFRRIECLLFLLNVLLDPTDELDVFCRSFAIQNTSASLYSIFNVSNKISSTQPGLLNFQFFASFVQKSIWHFGAA